MRCIVTRATANAVIDGVIAVQYRGRKGPAIQDVTTVSLSESWISPPEGTA